MVVPVVIAKGPQLHQITSLLAWKGDGLSPSHPTVPAGIFFRSCAKGMVPQCAGVRGGFYNPAPLTDRSAQGTWVEPPLTLLCIPDRLILRIARFAPQPWDLSNMGNRYRTVSGFVPPMSSLPPKHGSWGRLGISVMQSGVARWCV